MIKTKISIILFLLSLSHFAWGQDGIMWGFEIKFKVETENVQGAEKFIDLEFFADDRYLDSRENNKVVKYDSITNEYRILLSYGGIGGESQVHYVHCPEIYIQVNLESLYSSKPKAYYALLPVYFENAKGSYQKYNLGTIDVSEFLNYQENFYKINGEWKVERLPYYEIIEVKADKSVHKRRNDEYELRRMNKLVKLELQDEN